MGLHNCTAGAGLVTATCVHWKDQANPGGLELPLLLIYIQIILSLENPVTVWQSKKLPSSPSDFGWRQKDQQWLFSNGLSRSLHYGI